MVVKMTGCSAAYNGEAGFAISGVDAELNACEAFGNGGPGFLVTGAPENAPPAKTSASRKLGRFLGQVSVNAIGSAIGGNIS